MIVTRPSQYNDTRAYLAVTDSDRSRFDGLSKLNVKQQKDWLAKQMEGAGWQTDRLVKGMLVAEDYYAEEIGQVKMGEEGFVKGSVALCGDAGYCPSPFSGVVSQPLRKAETRFFANNTRAPLALFWAHTSWQERSWSRQRISRRLCWSTKN